jgi:hypothetical protein
MIMPTGVRTAYRGDCVGQAWFGLRLACTEYLVVSPAVTRDGKLTLFMLPGDLLYTRHKRSQTTMPTRGFGGCGVAWVEPDALQTKKTFLLPVKP